VVERKNWRRNGLRIQVPTPSPKGLLLGKEKDQEEKKLETQSMGGKEGSK